MSKNPFLEDNELQKLTASPTNTFEDSDIIYSSRPNTGNIQLQIDQYQDDQCFTSPFSPQVKNLSKSMASASDKKKIEKSQSGPAVPSRNPSVKLSSTNSPGYSKVNHSSEKKQDTKKNERAFVHPPQKKESSSSIFGRSPSISFKHSPLLSLRHKDEQTKSPGHFWLKDHFMGKQNPLQKQVKKKGPGGSGIPLRVRGEIVGPVRRVGGHCSPLRKMERPTQHHTFSSDASDVQQIEKKLLQLMDDFETGKLKAFGKDSRLRQMEEIREQQERLARLHFDVGAEQDLYPPLSEDGLKISEKNMKTLMEKLAQLSESIENLHTNTHSDRKACPSNGKHSNGSHSLFAESSQSPTQSFNSDALHSASTSHNSAPQNSSAHHTPFTTNSHHASSHQAPATSHHSSSHHASSHHAPVHSVATTQHTSSQHASPHSAVTSHHHHHHHKTSKTKEQQSPYLETSENLASCASSSNKVNVLNPGNNGHTNPTNLYQMKTLSTQDASSYPPPKLKLKHTA